MAMRQPARIVTKYISVQPQVAQAGQQVTIATNVANEGEETGNFTAVLRVNGAIEGTTRGVLSGRTAAPIEFTIAKMQPGTYSIDINGQQAILSIVGGSADNSDETQTAIPYIIIASIIILIVSGIAVVRIRMSY
jgi:hypothetical protein